MIEKSHSSNTLRVAPDSIAARIFLSFMATAGLFYANIMPAIVDGLISGLGFSPGDAGFVGSANVYGAAVGALLVVFLIRRIQWRPVAYTLLLGLIAMDLLSMLVSTPEIMIPTRFLHGMIGGALVGVSFAVIARASKPDRTFGILLVVQFGLGGLGNLFLPRLVPMFGTEILFLSLIAFSAATLAMIPFLSKYPPREISDAARAKQAGIAIMPLSLTLLAIFLFQAANMGLFAFIIGLAKNATLELDFITWTLALSGWIGIAGALLVVWMHTRYGRTGPVAIAYIVTILGFWALHHSDHMTLFLIANCAMGITWAFVIPYLLGLASEFDQDGQMAALGGFASKMGLASGPMVSGILLGINENYSLLINLGIVCLIVSMAVGVMPALRQDALAKAGVT